MKLFNPDSPLMRFFEKAANCFVLNVMLIICSLPIITIGPAITAVYWVALKMVRNEESGIIQEFLHSFRVNLKQGIIVGLIVLGFGVFLAFELYWTYQIVQDGFFFDKFVFAFLIFMSAVYIMTSSYIWPLLAKYNNSTKQLFRTATALAVRHIMATVVIGVIAAIPIIMLMYSLTTQAFALLFYLLLGIPAVAYFQSIFMVRIFDQYPTSDAEESEDTEVLPEE